MERVEGTERNGYSGIES